MIVEKDLKRTGNQGKKKDIHVSVENLYEWIELAFKKVANNPQAVINCFHKAGFAEQVVEVQDPVGIPLNDLSLNLSEVFEVLEEQKEEVVEEKVENILEDQMEEEEVIPFRKKAENEFFDDVFL